MTSEERRQREMRKKSKAILDAADEREWGVRVKATVTSLAEPNVRTTFCQLWYAQEAELARGDPAKVEMLNAECIGIIRGWFVLTSEPAPSHRNMLKLTDAGRKALQTKAAEAAA
jgi:hypothetical protein